MFARTSCATGRWGGVVSTPGQPLQPAARLQSRAPRRLVCRAEKADKSKVSIKLQQQVPFKTYFKVCGGTKQLGNWKLEEAPAMKWSEGDVWSLDIISPAGTEVEYKIVKVPRREPIKWEGGANRKVVVPEEDPIQYSLVFDDPGATQAMISPPSAAAAPADTAAPPAATAPPAPAPVPVPEPQPEPVPAPPPPPVAEVIQAPAPPPVEESPEQVVQAVTEAVEKAKQEGMSEAEALAEAVREAVAKAREEGKAEAAAATQRQQGNALQMSSSGKVVAASTTAWKEENGINDQGLDYVKLSVDLVTHISPLAGAVRSVYEHFSKDSSSDEGN